MTHSPLPWDELGSSPRARVVPRTIQAALNDRRPKVFLPGDDRPMWEVAAELGKHLSDRLYVHNGEIVALAGSVLRKVDVQMFRTLAEEAVVCCRQRTSGHGSVQVEATMTADESRGILSAPQFSVQLRNVARVNTVQLPTIREDGRIELLPEGYDEATRTLTVSAARYPDDLPLNAGIETIRDLFSEFEFSDHDRSLSVAIAALVGLYAAQLVPEGELRPAFTYRKNAEGAGGTMCATCAIVPVLGYLPTAGKAGEDDEMRKLITSTIREGRPVLFLDNVKGRLDCASLERLTSSPTWNDRLLSVNETITAPNNVTIFITGNNLTNTSDWRRRSLFIELHLSAERAEDRRFKRTLSVPTLLSMRSNILAACWALVRNWDAKGRPSPTRTHSAFPVWANVIGGIVEAAGFGCPLDTAPSAIAADEDGDDMRTLVSAMTLGKTFTNRELADLCRTEDIFSGLLGRSEDKMTAANRSAWGYVLARYRDRSIGERRFIIEGKGHGRRFSVESIECGQHGRMVEHGISSTAIHTCAYENEGNTMRDHATMPDKQGQHGLFFRSGGEAVTILDGIDHATVQSFEPDFQVQGSMSRRREVL